MTRAIDWSSVDAQMDDATREMLESMKAEHRRLDEQIIALSAEPLFDQLEIARLKRRKLQLKDHIQLMIDRNTPDIIA
ncbi:MAG TPA: YdcH family protein [Sphingomicrobium sp.]|nr:YdcH family protein [Sphingomicrobium sp.]